MKIRLLLAALIILLPTSFAFAEDEDENEDASAKDILSEIPDEWLDESEDSKTVSENAADKKKTSKPETVEPEDNSEKQESTAPKISISDFIDTKISFTYADDNVLENSEFSPAMGIGQKKTSEILGKTNDINAHDISQTHLVVHHKSDGYIKHLMTEAGLVLKFNLATDPYDGEVDPSVADGGSYVRIGYIFDQGEKDQSVLDATCFPYDSDTFLLGYHYSLAWAGSSSFPQNTNPIPGFRLGYDHPMGYGFVGFKTALQAKKDKLNTERVPVETVYSFLSGFGVRPIDGLVLEANGGFIQRGDNPTIPEATGDEKRDDILAWGISARVAYQMGLKIGDRMDLHLYQNDPRNRIKLARNDEYIPGTFSFNVSVEGNFLSQNLQDPDPKQSGGTKPLQAPAALLGAKFKIDYFRIYVEGVYRSLEFLVFDTPGMVAFMALPDGAQIQPEWSGILAFDYHIKPAYLTLGLGVGFKRPAAYKGSSGDLVSVIKTRIASNAYMSPFSSPIEILPKGESARNIFEVKFNTEFDLSDFMTLLFELSYTRDENKAKLETNPSNSETVIKVFEDDSIVNQLGIALIVQAAF